MQPIQPKTNYDEILPKDKIIFSLKDLDDLGLISGSMSRKMIYNRSIEVLKVGAKNYITRVELIRYFTAQTILAENEVNYHECSA